MTNSSKSSSSEANPANTKPGPSSPKESNTQSLMSITYRPDAVMVRGCGSYLWDSEGRRFLDFIQGWAVNALGHSPTEIVDSLATQAAQLISPSPAFHNAPQVLLANRLVELCSLGKGDKRRGQAQVHFSNSGSEANEVAVKLSRKWGQKNKPGAFEVITTENSFHGRTLAMMAACGKPGWDEIFPPVMPGFKKVPFGDIEAVAAAISDQTVAIMVEPIQGEAGVIVPPAGYLVDLRTLANDTNVLLVLDEVQTGVGRTGRFFAFEHEELRPDIVTLGKGLGGGVPISATLAAPHACSFEHGDQGGTYNGNPLMTAVALAVVDTVSDPDFLKNVQANADLMQQQLNLLADEFKFTSVRGSGLLWGVDLPDARALDVQQRAFDAGLLINAPRPATLRMMPALNVSESQIVDAMNILQASLG